MLSQSNSQEDVKLAQNKQESNRTKQTIKRLLNAIDSEQTGMVKADAFFMIIKMHKIELSEAHQARLRAECQPSYKKGFLFYKEALQRITIDLNSADPMRNQWIIVDQGVQPRRKTYERSLHSSQHLSDVRSSVATKKSLKMLNQSLTDIKTKEQYNTIRPQAENVLQQEVDNAEENPGDAYGNDAKSVESRREPQPRQQDDFRIRNSSSVEGRRKLQPSQKQVVVGSQSTQKISGLAMVQSESAQDIIYSMSLKELKPDKRQKKPIEQKPTYDYSMLSNLTKEQEKSLQDPEQFETMNQAVSRGYKSKQHHNEIKPSHQERPMVMRSEVVDSYFDHIMKEVAQPELVEVIKNFYKQRIDSRIFNNMKVHMNELIDNEESLISGEEFKKIFFTYFRGESKAEELYSSVLPFVTFDENKADSDVSIQKLSKLIDSFCFYPVKVGTIHYKNNSSRLEKVISKNDYGIRQKANISQDKLQLYTPKSAEAMAEKARLIKLLSLVSDKLNERFPTFQAAFRFFDADHSQSISMNEFANVIDYLRLKLSFDDITKLFRFMDKTGNGALGYNEMLLLKDENWKKVKDPLAVLNQNIKTKQLQLEGQSSPTATSALSKSVSGLALSASQLEELEIGCRPKLKRPLRQNKLGESMLNINKKEAPSYAESRSMVPMGIKNQYNSSFVDILKHKDLVDSMERKVAQNEILKKIQKAQKMEQRHRNLLPTKTTALRTSFTQEKIRGQESELSSQQQRTAHLRPSFLGYGNIRSSGRSMPPEEYGDSPVRIVRSRSKSSRGSRNQSLINSASSGSKERDVKSSIGQRSNYRYNNAASMNMLQKAMQTKKDLNRQLREINHKPKLKFKPVNDNESYNRQKSALVYSRDQFSYKVGNN